MAEETIKQNTLQTNGKMQNALLKIHLSSSDYNATAVQKFVQERYLVFDLLTLSWFWFQPDVGQDGSLTRIEQRAFVSHGPLWTHVTNLLISVSSCTGNSFGSLSVLCQANTGQKTDTNKLVPFEKVKVSPK